MGIAYFHVYFWLLFLKMFPIIEETSMIYVTYRSLEEERPITCLWYFLLMWNSVVLVRKAFIFGAANLKLRMTHKIAKDD